MQVNSSEISVLSIIWNNYSNYIQNCVKKEFILYFNKPETPKQKKSQLISCKELLVGVNTRNSNIEKELTLYSSIIYRIQNALS